MTLSLMIQGTGSDVGKSLLVAGLGRAFTRRGLRVRPFKPQNMSNNAAVTKDGGEIGRAQALQARACETATCSDMNPVLLKPETEGGAQVVVQGNVTGHAGAREFHALKPALLAKVMESFERLGEEADLILIEGAGSPAEVNLRHGDIANMGFAQEAGVPVVLAGDIERGGVIAQLVGTWELLNQGERDRLRGCIINRFRGDKTLFEPALEIISERTGLPCFGVVPHFADAAKLPAEDSMALGRDRTNSAATGAISIAVPVFSRIANFDDLDPLAAEPDVTIQMVRAGEALPGDADLIILPGSKSTLADLAVMRREGWDIDLKAHQRRGGFVLGICGGYQMLGTRVSDPDGIEGAPGEAAGLALLHVETVLTHDKELVETSGGETETNNSLHGYRMHMGRTHGEGIGRPWLRLDGEPHGAVSADGHVRGCYLHGLFAADGFRHGFLDRIRRRGETSIHYDQAIDETLNELAHHLEENLDLDKLLEVARAG